ncbi:MULTISPECIES: YecA family protein [Ramlibacter]|uniref:UPF0149 family protein n=1 Tax=Ramlibacter pinisoli TaxID=2682844 RepID=A0A6N8IUX0_9BURK|nr:MULTISPECIES: YecA family protein [Ramlibacter]MBA2965671.1 UPF0149 family protein [Ramlibacter sp. CGMCC 1.13660]MVQ30637.1 UPF0149 family protein [Ramlibacter pinisoli]
MTPATPDPAPLAADDYDALDAELDLLREHDPETPDWEFCEGFLAALVCCRREIPPEEYWPALFGDAFRPMAHMELVWRWHRRRQEIAQALDAEVDTLEDERALQPEVLDVRGAVLALPEGERGDADPAQLPSFGQAWAEGFLHAVRTWPADWTPPRDKEVAAMLEEALDDVAALAGPDSGEPALNMHTEGGAPSVSEHRLDVFGEAIWAVYDLRQLWKSLGPRVEPLRQAPQPGRNDPCPCGSGKKYKKCHGA